MPKALISLKPRRKKTGAQRRIIFSPPDIFTPSQFLPVARLAPIGVLKNKTPFNAETDDLNQQKSIDKQHQNEQKEKAEGIVKKQKKHRFQEVSTDAPISRRAEQKNKKSR